jgi:hypothetical protein
MQIADDENENHGEFLVKLAYVRLRCKFRRISGEENKSRYGLDQRSGRTEDSGWMNGA